MNTILDIQKKFFLTGQESDLKPMVLRNISERTNFDISTVSRISNSKYVQTEYGVYSLKFFFSEGMINDEGEEISTRTIMKKIEDIIEAEDKKNPLSDEKITAELKNYGFNIARRTTAKYRENLNIQPKHLRKFILKS
jgi:RNA polymerase sigma-54 factor